jgi:hypothetical protein
MASWIGQSGQGTKVNPRHSKKSPFPDKLWNRIRLKNLSQNKARMSLYKKSRSPAVNRASVLCQINIQIIIPRPGSRSFGETFPRQTRSHGITTPTGWDG